MSQEGANANLLALRKAARILEKWLSNDVRGQNKAVLMKELLVPLFRCATPDLLAEACQTAAAEHPASRAASTVVYDRSAADPAGAALRGADGPEAGRVLALAAARMAALHVRGRVTEQQAASAAWRAATELRPASGSADAPFSLAGHPDPHYHPVYAPEDARTLAWLIDQNGMGAELTAMLELHDGGKHATSCTVRRLLSARVAFHSLMAMACKLGKLRGQVLTVLEEEHMAYLAKMGIRLDVPGNRALIMLKGKALKQHVSDTLPRLSKTHTIIPPAEVGRPPHSRRRARARGTSAAPLPATTARVCGRPEVALWFGMHACMLVRQDIKKLGVSIQYDARELLAWQATWPGVARHLTDYVAAGTHCIGLPEDVRVALGHDGARVNKGKHKEEADQCMTVIGGTFATPFKTKWTKFLYLGLATCNDKFDAMQLHLPPAYNQDIFNRAVPITMPNPGEDGGTTTLQVRAFLHLDLAALHMVLGLEMPIKTLWYAMLPGAFDLSQQFDTEHGFVWIVLPDRTQAAVNLARASASDPQESQRGSGRRLVRAALWRRRAVHLPGDAARDDAMEVEHRQAVRQLLWVDEPPGPLEQAAQEERRQPQGLLRGQRRGDQAVHQAGGHHAVDAQVR